MGGKILDLIEYYKRFMLIFGIALTHETIRLSSVKKRKLLISRQICDKSKNISPQHHKYIFHSITIGWSSQSLDYTSTSDPWPSICHIFKIMWQCIILLKCNLWVECVEILVNNIIEWRSDVIL